MTLSVPLHRPWPVAAPRPEQVPPDALLSTRERYRIGAAVVAVMVPARVAVPILAFALGMPVMLDLAMRGIVSILIISSALPLTIGIMQGIIGRPFWLRALTHAGLAIGYIVLTQLTAATVMILLTSVETDPVAFIRILHVNAQMALLYYATAAGVARAVHWYRSSQLADEARRREEEAEIQRTRQLVEDTLRPIAVVRALQSVREMLTSARRQEAQRLVMRLARHARVALGRLNTRVPDERHESPVPPAVSVRLRGSTYTWLTAFLLFTVILTVCEGDVGDALSAQIWLAAAVIWPLTALPLLWIVQYAVRRRWPVSLAIVMTAIWVIGTAVSVLSIRLGTYVHGDVEGMPIRLQDVIGFVLPFVLTKNVLLACAITAVSFANAAGAMLLVAQERAARLRNQVALAEIREVEARIQPHFLFNALSSLLALINMHPERAGTMAVRLQDLFARAVASSGIQSWSLREELELITDYLDIQQIRYPDRLRVVVDVEPRALNAAVPRLVLQPLVENAVKHGVAMRDEPTTVEIRARHQDRKQLALTIRNDAIQEDAPANRGEGLAFVIARVRSVDGTVSLGYESRGKFAVHCTIPVSQRMRTV